MCDGYAQSTQHARAVAWLERGPLLVWLDADTNTGGSDHENRTKQRTRQVTRLQAGARSLLHAAVAEASAKGFSVEQSPASR